MKTETIDHQILGIVKSYCKPQLVNNLLKELRKAEVFEQKLTKARNGKAKLRTREVSVSEAHKLNQVLTLCHATLRKPELFQVLIGIGDVFRGHGELTRAEEMYTMALTQGEKSEEKGLVGEAYMRRGDLYCRQGRWRDSASDLDQSRRIYRELKEEVAVGRVENILGTNCAVQGKLKQAQSYFRKALTSFERSEETLMTGTVLMNMGIVYNIMGQYDVSLTQYQRARSHFEEVGDLTRLSELHHNMGMTYLLKGMYTEAVREFNVSGELSGKLQNVQLQGLASLGKANAYYRKKDLRMALTLVNQALEYFTVSNDRLAIADGYKVKGMIHREMKKYSFAETYFRTSVRINLELQNELNTGETYYELGVFEKQRGRREDARRAFEEALGRFKKVGARIEVHRTQAELTNMRDGGR